MKIGIRKTLEGYQVWFKIDNQTFHLDEHVEETEKDSLEVAQFFERMLKVAFEKLDIHVVRCSINGLKERKMKYKTIVIDPPWKYGKWGKASKPNYKGHEPKESNLPYDWMTIKQIKDLPINNLAEENCEVYVWTTQKYLPDTFAVLKAWGLKYCQTLTWCKKPMGTGQGGVYCPTTEFLILARKGKMPKITRLDSTWWEVSRAWKAHSKKPEFFQDLIETVSEEPRLEMFARRERKGWAVFGNEVDNSIDLGEYYT